MAVQASPRLVPASGIAGAVVGLVACLVLAAAAAVAVAATGSILPLAGAVAGLLAIVLLARPWVGTLLFLAIIWSNAPAVLARQNGLPPGAVNLVAVLLVIPVAGYLLRGKPVVVTPALFALLAFLGANLLSAATSSNPTLAVSEVMTLAGEGVLVYLLVSNAVRTPRAARAAMWVMVVMSVVLAGLTVHQEITGAYRDTYFGFAETTRIDEPVLAVGQDGRPRAMGPIGEQNRFAQVLLVVVPLAVVGLQTGGSVLARVIPSLSALVILAAVFLTFSRGAIVALAALLVIMVLQRYVRVRDMLAVVLVLGIAVVAVAPQVIERIGSIGATSTLVSGEGADPDGAILGRTTSNLAALAVFVDYPITGVGPGVYAADYSQVYGNEVGLRYFDTTRRAHNMYLEWAADLGVIGLVAGVATIGITILQLMRLRRFWSARRPDHAALAGAFALALIVYLATAVFLHLSYMRYFFTLLALANSVIWILSREREAALGPTPAADPSPSPQRLGDQPS